VLLALASPVPLVLQAPLALVRLAAFGISGKLIQILLVMNRCSQIFLMQTLKMI
jgi:hypothetical protein